MTKLLDIVKSSHVSDGAVATQDLSLDAEVCIIGSGAGGAVSAATLAQAGRDVLIVEEGGYHTHDDFNMNEADVYPKLYQDGLRRASKDGGIIILQGRTVGGSTVVNWTTSFRTPESVLSTWATEHAVKGFAAEDLAPHFDWIEGRLSIGPVNEGYINANNRKLKEGCDKLGWQVAPLKRNVYACMNSGYCGMGCPYNAKRSMLVTMIPDAIDAGARLLHRARVDRLVASGGELVEAHGTLIGPDGWTPSGRKLRIRAKRFIVSCGAINSPALLLRSGINDHDLVGRRTFVHPTVLAAGLYDEVIEPFYGAPQSMASHHFVHRGGEVGFFLEAAPAHPMLASATLPGFGQEHRDLIAQLAKSGVHIAIHVDGFHEGAPGGRVELTESGAPLLDYPITPALLSAFRFAQQKLAELQLASGAKASLAFHEPPLYMRSTADIAKLDDLPWRTGSFGVFTAHQMGGNPMGDDATRAVVRSEDLRHHRLRNLYVIDGSVFPTALGVNPQESIYGLARLMATRMKA